MSEQRLSREVFLGITVLLCAATGCVDAGGPWAIPSGGEPLGERARPILLGTPTADYPAVGALTEHGYPFCTGTLVSKTLVLTAAHCLVDLDLAATRFVVGPDAFRPAAEFALVRAEPHPDYDPALLLHDIALLELAVEAPVPPFGLLPRLDESDVGRPLTFVGYGVTDGHRHTGLGLKRQVTVPLAALDATTFRYSELHGGTCYGDSGGPALVATEHGLRVAGVTSYGDAGCDEYAVDTRVDVYLDWLRRVGLPLVGTGTSSEDPEPAGGDPQPPGAGGGEPSGELPVVGEHEPNGSRREATRLSGPALLTGRLHQHEDVDTFRLELPREATLHLTLFVPTGLDYDLVLAGADGQELGCSQRETGQDEELSFTNPSGRPRVLYVEVYGFDGSWSAAKPYLLEARW